MAVKSKYLEVILKRKCKALQKFEKGMSTKEVTIKFDLSGSSLQRRGMKKNL